MKKTISSIVVLLLAGLTAMWWAGLNPLTAIPVWISSSVNYITGQWDAENIILSLVFLAAATILLGSIYGAYKVWKDGKSVWPQRFFYSLMITSFLTLFAVFALRIDGLKGLLTLIETERSSFVAPLVQVGQGAQIPPTWSLSDWLGEVSLPGIIVTCLVIGLPLFLFGKEGK